MKLGEKRIDLKELFDIGVLKEKVTIEKDAERRVSRCRE